MSARNNKIGSGERQVGPLTTDIRRDHTGRYEHAAQLLPPRSTVLDLACGVGYGSWILAEAGHFVLGVDISEESIAYAKRHYSHERVRFAIGNADAPVDAGRFDAVVSFETVEHILDPSNYLTALDASILIASVPNQRVFPWNPGIAFHFRHYTRGEFEALLNRCGWIVERWFGQRDQWDGEIVENLDGWTLVALCARDRAAKPVGFPELL